MMQTDYRGGGRKDNEYSRDVQVQGSNMRRGAARALPDSDEYHPPTPYFTPASSSRRQRRARARPRRSDRTQGPDNTLSSSRYSYICPPQSHPSGYVYPSPEIGTHEMEGTMTGWPTGIHSDLIKRGKGKGKSTLSIVGPVSIVSRRTKPMVFGVSSIEPDVLDHRPPAGATLADVGSGTQQYPVLQRDRLAIPLSTPTLPAPTITTTRKPMTRMHPHSKTPTTPAALDRLAISLPSPTIPSSRDPQAVSISTSVWGPIDLSTPTITTKRKRTLSTGPHPTAPTSPAVPLCKRTKVAEYKKHHVYWELDGDVIVRIKDVGFRLRQSRLAKMSGWFRAAFQKEEGDSRAVVLREPRGDAVVCLDEVGVSVNDFEVLLDALDSIIKYFYSTPPFDVVASILRASSALSFTDLAGWSTRYLQDMWQPSLANFSPAPISFATESVILARQCSIPSILKRALYEIVRTEAFGENDDEGEINAFRLSSADTRRLQRAREKLISLWITASLSGNFTTCPSSSESIEPKGKGIKTECPTNDGKQATLAHVKIVHASGIFEKYHYDPMCGFQALMEAPWAEEGFCQACVEMGQVKWGEAREKCWKDLDTYFGIGVVI